MHVEVERDAGDDVCEVDLHLGSQIRAARRSRSRVAGRPEECLPEERGEDVGQAAEVGAHRREAAAPQARVPEAVVQLAPLGVREHLVRLGDRTEAQPRVRGVAHIRMELACEPAERTLDLGVARVARHAEQLVVVLLGGRHH